MNKAIRCLFHTVLLTLAVSSPHAIAATLPAGFAETLVAGSLSYPMSMAFAPDGRLFVCLQGGQVRVIKNGALLPTPFVTLPVNFFGEHGLLGIAFDPNFTVNQYVYIHYTAATPTAHNRVSRFTANGDVAVAGSELVLLELDTLTSGFHSGGALRFGVDGKLYVAVGDNGTPSNAQTLDNVLGKMLRINPDGTIPLDNPFYLQAAGKNRAIWGLGLRNPFTIAVEPGTGRIFINDVGQDTYEEINDGRAGANYGWPESEGPTTNANHQGPLYSYFHGTSAVTGCAITGGVFYKPLVMQFPQQYLGRYFFADWCSGWINTFDASTGGVATFASAIHAPVDLQLAPDGRLYYLTRDGGAEGVGAVYKIDTRAVRRPRLANIR